MSETEKLTVGALMTVLLIFTPGFLLHEAPLFPGSPPGQPARYRRRGGDGVAARLSAGQAPYAAAAPPDQARFDAGNPLIPSLCRRARALLRILHIDHKFQSPLGISFVASMLIVVLRGFVGRYYMAHLTAELRDQKAMPDTQRAQYDRIATELAGSPIVRSLFGLPRLWMGRLAPVSAGPDTTAGAPGITVPELVNAIEQCYLCHQTDAWNDIKGAGWYKHH